MKSRKASLELSINAIVILILAITMLGLGLGFMRNIFGSATQQFTQVTGEVEKQMIEQLKSSGKIVDLDRPKITVKRGDTEQIYIGFKNVKSTDTYYKLNPPTGSTISEFTDAECNPSTGKVRIEYKGTTTTVQSGDVVVLPINIKSDPSANSGTCFFQLEIEETDSAGTSLDTPVKFFTQLTVDVTV